MTWQAIFAEPYLWVPRWVSGGGGADFEKRDFGEAGGGCREGSRGDRRGGRRGASLLRGGSRGGSYLGQGVLRLAALRGSTAALVPPAAAAAAVAAAAAAAAAVVLTPCRGKP